MELGGYRRDRLVQFSVHELNVHTRPMQRGQLDDYRVQLIRLE